MRIGIVFLIIAITFTTFLNISSTEASSWSPPKNIQNKSVGEIKYKYCRFQARQGQKKYVTSEGERAFGSSGDRRAGRDMFPLGDKRAFVPNHFWTIH